MIELSVNGGIAVMSAGLNLLHKDPADRFIVVAALTKNAALETADATVAMAARAHAS